MFYNHLNRAIDALGIHKESTVAWQCRNMVDEEFMVVREQWRKNNPRKREPTDELYSEAADRVVKWYREACNLDIAKKDLPSLSAIRHFVATHRIACTWATFLWLEHQAGLGFEHRAENVKKELDKA